MVKHLSTLAMALALTAIAGCSSKPANTEAAAENNTSQQRAGVEVPAFCADSAYEIIARQVSFGPRVPGSQSHKKCGEYLVDKLKATGAEVNVQRKNITDFSGNKYEIANIFARLNPQATRRVLLVAHWDTRPWADEDPVEANRNKAIDGANDGASGVAVICEIARHIAAKAPAVGIDILFTDAEDSGLSAPDDADDATILKYENSWCLGTQHWLASNPYSDGNTPAFGILLDMVGARDAKFPPEFFSSRYARSYVNKVLAAAQMAGTSNRFPEAVSGAINDDHVHLNRAGIPTINIIDTRPGQGSGFNPTWHTMADNLENIDRSTLDAVGRTIMTLIYNEPAK